MSFRQTWVFNWICHFPFVIFWRIQKKSRYVKIRSLYYFQILQSPETVEYRNGVKWTFDWMTGEWLTNVSLGIGQFPLSYLELERIFFYYSRNGLRKIQKGEEYLTNRHLILGRRTRELLNSMYRVDRINLYQLLQYRNETILVTFRVNRCQLNAKVSIEYFFYGSQYNPFPWRRLILGSYTL